MTVRPGESVLRLRVLREVVVQEIDQFDRRVRMRMRQLGWHQGDLGRAMGGLSKERISKILRQQRIGEEVFLRLQRALGYQSSDWVLPLPKPEGIDPNKLIATRIRDRIGGKKTEREREK
jgi:transcriptional regulator with XRE-family HTH domain